VPQARDQRGELYNWRAKYGGLEVSEAKRLKGLESENTRLKKLLADAMLDNAALKDLLAKKINGDARCQREAVAHRFAFDMSERRACRTIGCARMTVRYRCRRPDDAELRERLRSLARARRRFGYRRLHVLLRREGFTVNHKRLFGSIGRQSCCRESASLEPPSRPSCMAIDFRIK
jgi:putative transposase